MANEVEITNAIIKSAKLSSGDHGLLSAWIFLDYGGCVQGFGGYALYLPKWFTHHNEGGPFAGHFIWRVMEVAGVTEWEDLPGKTVRARRTWDHVEAIGHIVKGDWFDPKAEFARLKGGSQDV